MNLGVLTGVLVNMVGLFRSGPFDDVQTPIHLFHVESFVGANQVGVGIIPILGPGRTHVDLVFVGGRTGTGGIIGRIRVIGRRVVFLLGLGSN